MQSDAPDEDKTPEGPVSPTTLFMSEAEREKFRQLLDIKVALVQHVKDTGVQYQLLVERHQELHNKISEEHVANAHFREHVTKGLADLTTWTLEHRAEHAAIERHRQQLDTLNEERDKALEEKVDSLSNRLRVLWAKVPKAGKTAGKYAFLAATGAGGIELLKALPSIAQAIKILME